MNRLTILLLLAWTITSVSPVDPKTNQKLDDEWITVNEGSDLTISCDKLIRDNEPPTLSWKWQKTHESTEEYVGFGSGRNPPRSIISGEPLNNRLSRIEEKLYWKSISKNASGIYSCYAPDNESPRRIVYLTVLNLTTPSVTLSGRLPTGENVTLTSEVVESGRHFKLFCDFPGSNAKCDENKQIEWYFPPDKEVYHDEELYYQSQNVTPLRLRQTQQCSNVSGNNQWILQVSNASYLDTGLYTCVNKTDNRTLSRHYVFVKDDKKPMLPPSSSIKKTNDSEHGLVVTNLSQRAIISLGCGPTNPSETISLARYNKTTNWADVLTGSHPKSETKAGPFRFNPLRGFEFNTGEATQWEHDATYSCTPLPHDYPPIEFKFKFQVIGAERNAVSAGAIAAIAVASSFVVIAIAAFAIVLFYRRRRLVHADTSIFKTKKYSEGNYTGYL